jgi:type II secretory pathway predicted ATPase ExeA
MPFTPRFDAPLSLRVHETPLMENVMERTMAVHAFGGIVAWSGESGSGKTTTARLMAARICEAAASTEHAFSAVHYEVGPLIANDDRVMSLALKSLYGAAIGRPPEHRFRMSTPDAIALSLVHGLRSRNIRMVFIDEAGLLSAAAVRGIVLAIDTAENEAWPLTVVMIGMDELPRALEQVPQTERRVRDWCYFKAIDAAEAERLVTTVWPEVRAFLATGTSLRDLVQCMMRRFGNVPGKIVPKLCQLRAWAARHSLALNEDVVNGFADVIAEDRSCAKEGVTGRHAKRPHLPPGDASAA